jgi:flagellar biosynthesis protein FlhB
MPLFVIDVLAALPILVVHLRAFLPLLMMDVLMAIVIVRKGLRVDRNDCRREQK